VRLNSCKCFIEETNIGTSRTSLLQKGVKKGKCQKE
jgi:hypothetical protein